MSETEPSILPEVIEVDGLPEPKDLPENAQQILALLALGWSQASVARTLKVNSSAVNHVVDRYDPQRSVTLTSRERRRFIAKLWEARASEALIHMTSDKMEDASLAVLSRVAATASKTMKELGADKDENDKDPEEILKSLGRVTDV